MSSTAEGTIRRMIDLMPAKDTNTVADLWAPDGTAAFPFAAGTSPRPLRGREEVRTYLPHCPEPMDLQEVAALTLRPTDHTDTVVVEWTAVGRTVATSRPYRLDHTVVLTGRDGLIAPFRDHRSPLSAAAAAGGLTALIDSVEIDSVDGKGA